MITIILIYLLIGWIIGFVPIILRSNDEIPIGVINLILYWPWFLVKCIIFLITNKETKNRRK